MFKVFSVRKIKYIVGIFVISVIVSIFATTGVIPINSSEIVKNARVVLLDAGHGGEDGGAISKTGVVEKDLNLIITLKVKQYLEENNIKVILTRESDKQEYDEKAKTMHQKKSQDIANRIKKANESNADMLISIHMNSYPEKDCKGWQVFSKKNCNISNIIAKNIQNQIGEITQISNLRQSQDITGVKLMDKSILPAVLVECGFLSNNEDLALLITEDYQNKIAQGICNGILKWYE